MPLCYRPYYNIDLFRFKFKLYQSCTGNCKFANILIENKFTPPFLELTEDHINDKNIKSINDFILKGYFKNRNILCNEEICISENVGSVQTFKYKILEKPPIISIYISMNETNINKFHDDINKLLNNDFVFENIKYNLLGIILMPTNDHFNVLFKNQSEIFKLEKNNWYFHDDLNGLIKKVEDIGYKNIIQSNNLCLFVYGV